MVFIPFLFFSYAFIRIIKRNGFDVSACMILMYIATSFASILLSFIDYDFGYDNYSKIEIAFTPTIVYCTFIGLCIYPFFKYNSNRHRKVLFLKNLTLFNWVSYLYIAVFFLILYIFKDDYLIRIAYGNFDELRKMSYAGELSKVVDNYSGILRFVVTLLTTCGEGAYFMIPFFFYSVCFLHKKKLFNSLLLISSLSPVLIGFLDIDRSKTVFWVLLFMISFCFFRPYINAEQKKKLRLVVMLVGCILVLYLAFVSVSRFGDRDEGALGSFLCYLGQPFINFCKIWDNVWMDNLYTQRVLPLTNYLFMNNNGSEITLYVNEVFQKTGVHINVFFSFLGMFLVDMGHLWAIIIPSGMFLVFVKIVNKGIRRRTTSLSTFIIFFSIAIIIQCGIITYFYTNIARVITFWMFVVLAKMFSKKEKA